MRNYLFPLVLLWAALSVQAQQSQILGTVALFNSQFETGKRQYISNASVEEDFGKSQAALTGADGSFRLPLIGIKDQEKVFYSVKKGGFEVVNVDALQAVAGQSDATRVFLAPEGKIAENKLKYYKINRAAAEKALTDKLYRLENDMAAAKNDQIRLKKLQEDYSLLQAQFDKIDDTARELADRYAKTNLDDVSADYQKAFRCFQRGQLDSALMVFKAIDLEANAAGIISEQNRNSDLAAEYERRDSEKNKRKNETVETLRFKANLHKSVYEFEKVENSYTLLLKLDSTDVNTLSEYAFYLDLQNNKTKAIQYFEKALAYSRNEIYESDFCNILGVMYSNMQRNNDAEKVYLRAFKIRERLYETNRFPGFIDGIDKQNAQVSVVEANRINYGKELAATTTNLALLYNDLNQFDKAEEMYNYTLKIYALLVNYIPEEIEMDIARFSVNLGTKKYYNNQKLEAETLFLSAEQILSRLAKEDPDLYLSEWITVTINLANLYASLKNEKAEALYLNSLKIVNDLVAKNPSRYTVTQITILCNFGDYYRNIQYSKNADQLYVLAMDAYSRYDQKNQIFDLLLAKSSIRIAEYYRNGYYYQKSLGFYNMGIAIYKQLATLNPFVYDGDLGVSLFEMGNIYYNLKLNEESEGAYLESIDILESLFARDTIRYGLDLAKAYMNFGILYKSLGRYESAEKLYLRSMEIRNFLVLKDPVQFEPSLARANMILANFYSVTNKPDKAENLYLKSFEIIERLVKEDSVRYEPESARIQENLGIFYDQHNQPIKAAQFYEGSLKIKERLVLKYPEQYEPELASLLEVMGLFYKENKRLIQSKESLVQALLIRTRAVQNGQTQFYTQLDQILGSLEDLRSDFETQKDYPTAADIQKQRAICYDVLRKIDRSLTETAAREYSVLSCYSLFARDFIGADAAALAAIQIMPEEHSFEISLAFARALQGQFNNAKVILLTIKDLETESGKTYGQVSLEFLAILESLDITHPNLPKIREILEQK